MPRSHLPQALHCLAEGPADWAAFLHSCVALGAAPGCCFVGLAHRDVAGDAPWLARLEHVAAVSAGSGRWQQLRLPACCVPVELASTPSPQTVPLPCPRCCRSWCWT